MLRKLSRQWKAIIMLLVGGMVLASCAPPPPLRSDKYLEDTSLITGQPCAAPCFQGIIVGTTTFADAVSMVKSNALFKDVQNRDATSDQPASAIWNSTSGEQCCQMIADSKGLVESITLRLAPKMTVGQVIEKLGEPQYTFSTEYTQEESVIQLLYPEQGIVLLVVPGDAESSLEAGDPAVAVIYLDPLRFQDLIKEATLQGWAGYQSFKTYKDATPIVTAVPTATPAP
jgi:hypothetical protein